MFVSLPDLSNSPKREEGQGLVEYALILVLVSVVVIVVLSLVGPGVGNIFSEVVSALNGGVVADDSNDPGRLELRSDGVGSAAGVYFFYIHYIDGDPGVIPTLSVTHSNGTGNIGHNNVSGANYYEYYGDVSQASCSSCTVTITASTGATLTLNMP